MVVIEKHQRTLARLGLATPAGVKACHGEVVARHQHARDILKIQADETILFLKRNWKANRKDGLRSWLRHGRVWSIARREWENSRALARAGLPTAGLVAYGEECDRLREKFSFIITEAAPGEDLKRFVETCADPTPRRRVLNALAHTVRRLHEAGLATPDLYAHHLFVVVAAVPPSFRLIDVARLERRRTIPPRLRARDLAALNVSLPPRLVSLRERLRFLRVYAGKLDPELVRAILARTRFLAQRPKYRGFFTVPDPT
jgi:heptose I phosphotransferase